MEDLIMTLSGNQISLKNFELHLGHIREADFNVLADNKDQPQNNQFLGKKSLLEYIDQKVNYDENGVLINYD